MGQVGLHLLVGTFEGQIESSHSEVVLENFICGVVESAVGSIEPEPAVLVTVVHLAGHVFYCFLPHG